MEQLYPDELNYLAQYFRDFKKENAQSRCLDYIIAIMERYDDANQRFDLAQTEAYAFNCGSFFEDSDESPYVEPVQYNAKDSTNMLEWGLEVANCMVLKGLFKLYPVPGFGDIRARDLCMQVLENQSQHNLETIAKAWYIIAKITGAGDTQKVKVEGIETVYDKTGLYFNCLTTALSHSATKTGGRVIDSNYSDCAIQLAAEWEELAKSYNQATLEMDQSPVVELLNTLKSVVSLLSATVAVGSTVSLALSFAPNVPGIDANTILSADKIAKGIEKISEKIYGVQSNVDKIDSGIQQAIVAELKQHVEVGQVLDSHKSTLEGIDNKTKSLLYTAIGDKKLECNYVYQDQLRSGHHLLSPVMHKQGKFVKNENTDFNPAVAIVCFLFALDKDPRNAKAMLGLSDAYKLLADDIKHKRHVQLQVIRDRSASREELQNSDLSNDQIKTLSRELSAFGQINKSEKRA